MNTRPASRPIPTPAIALAIGAHPDDIEFNCGATLAKWSFHGCEVHHLILTDGSKGSWEPATDPAALVALRQAESVNAASRIGASAENVHFLGLVDGELEQTADIRSRICAVIRKVKPDVVLGHDPWKRYRLHPDHRAAGFLTVDAIVNAREPHYSAGQDLPAHRPDALLLFEPDEADHVEDAANWEQPKIDALLEHKSQYASTMDIKDENDASGIERFSHWVIADLAEKGSLAGLRAGEAFKLLTHL